MHVRLQTWAPYTMQICVNGHDWLAQQMARLQMGFVLQHNAFTQLDEPAKAQRLADGFASLEWNKIFNHYAHLCNPFLKKELESQPPTWYVEQAEFATDLLFKSRAALSGLYQKLLHFATLAFTPKDIYGFLGRKFNRCFDGELQTETKTSRHFGTRVKHRVKRNWLKMYDKFGLIPKKVNGRSFAGFNPARKEDVRAFAAVLAGDGIARGFRNQDIRDALFPLAPNSANSADPSASSATKTRRKARRRQNAEQRRQSAAVGRLLKRMHHRRWLAKIPRSRRWHVTDEGRHLLSLAIKHYAQTWPELASVS